MRSPVTRTSCPRSPPSVRRGAHRGSTSDVDDDLEPRALIAHTLPWYGPYGPLPHPADAGPNARHHDRTLDRDALDLFVRVHQLTADRQQRLERDVGFLHRGHHARDVLGLAAREVLDGAARVLLQPADLFD